MRASADCSKATAYLLLAHMGVRERDKVLIRAYAQREQDPAVWTALFSGLIVEFEPFVFNYLLARLGARFGWKLVPADLVPKLSGVRKKFVAKNAVLLSDSLAFVRMLNGSGITPLLVRGGALRLGLLPDIPQKMTDVDAVVSRDEYETCCALAKKRGYELPYSIVHSADFKIGGKPCVDLHHTVFKGNMLGHEPSEAILANATQVTRGGAVFFVPSPEDAFLITMVNAVSNYLTRDAGKGPITWLADCIDLSERYDLSYQLVVDHAREYGVYADFLVALALMKSLVPDTFAELCELAGNGVSRRLHKRLAFCTRRLQEVGGEGDSGNTTLGHFARVASYLYAEYLSVYNLDASTPEVAAGFCRYLWQWLKTVDGIDHVWDVPKVVLRRAGAWRRNRKGA